MNRLILTVPKAKDRAVLSYSALSRWVGGVALALPFARSDFLRFVGDHIVETSRWKAAVPRMCYSIAVALERVSSWALAFQKHMSMGTGNRGFSVRQVKHLRAELKWGYWAPWPTLRLVVSARAPQFS